jgi:hypothetical protein
VSFFLDVNDVREAIGLQCLQWKFVFNMRGVLELVKYAE